MAKSKFFVASADGNSTQQAAMSPEPSLTVTPFLIQVNR